MQPLLEAVNPPLALVGVVLGFYVRRVGRTALLVRTQHQALTTVGTATAESVARSTGADAAEESTATADTYSDDSASADTPADGAQSSGSGTNEVTASRANTDGGDTEYDDFGFQRD